MVPSFTALLVAISSFFSLSASPAPHPVERTHAVCSAPAAGDVACLAKVYGYASDGHVAPAARTASLPTGLNPVQLRSAYQIPAATGGRVAVIGAYDNPNAKADLDAYSQTFGLAKLPQRTCRISAWAYDFKTRRVSLIPGFFEVDPATGAVNPLGQSPEMAQNFLPKKKKDSAAPAGD